MRVKSKVETVEEYLARGGSIKKIPQQPVEPQVEVIRKQAGGPATIMTLDEADLFFGEAKASKAKKQKTSVKVDLNALPESLRKKFISKLRDEEYDGEEEELEDEDSDEDDGDDN